VSWITHRNCEPLVPVSKFSLFSTLPPHKEDNLRLDGKPKVLPEKLGSAVVTVATDSRATRDIGRLQYMTAEKVAVGEPGRS
jgi:hypothetical protein